MSERMKYDRYHNISATHYFWRTTQQQEVDLIEEVSDILSAYEFKWSKNERPRFPVTFTSNYPDAQTKVISPENVEEFLG